MPGKKRGCRWGVSAGQTGLQAAGLGAGREKGLDTTGGNHAGPWVLGMSCLDQWSLNI